MSQVGSIKNALVTVPYTGRHWDTLRDALAPAEIVRVDHGDTPEVLAAVRDADTAILGGNLSDEMLAAGQRLRWVHCDMAGVNDSARPEVFRRGIHLTASAGRSAPVLAEHAFFLTLSLVYASRELEVNQRAHTWKNLYTERRGLYTKTLGVVGLGHTGRAVARLGAAFGMRVLGYDRGGPDVPVELEKACFADRGDTVDELLGESDVVVLAVRLSDETYHMMGDRAFGLMKPTAYLINMARGAVVDEAALLRALTGGTIAGAGSDVFETEPLPAGSPLWDLPNMVITPHCTPEVPDLTASSLEIICDNIRRYRRGEALRNELDARDVYTMARG